MGKSKTFCPLPWNSLTVETNGQARPCCVSQDLVRCSDGKPWKISQHTFKQAQEGESQVALRRALSQGEKPTACIECWKTEEIGGESLRQMSLKKFPSVSSRTEPTLRHLDLKLGNHCNLKCRTCGPAYSTSWYNDANATDSSTFYQGNGKYQIVRTKNGLTLDSSDFQWATEPDFWKNLIQLVEESKNTFELNFQGGEPLINSGHLPFLRELKERDITQKVKLSYVTNLTVLPQEVLQLWKKIENVRIAVSLDGIGAVNDYIRFPSRFSRVEANVDQLAEHHVRFCIQTSISWLNALYVPDLIRWSFKKGLEKSVPYSIYFHLVYYPLYLQPKILPQQSRRAILERIRTVRGELIEFAQRPKPWWLAYDGNRHSAWLEGLEKALDHEESYGDLFSEGIRVTKDLDRVRNQNIATQLPDLWKSMRPDSSGELSRGADLGELRVPQKTVETNF